MILVQYRRRLRAYGESGDAPSSRGHCRQRADIAPRTVIVFISIVDEHLQRIESQYNNTVYTTSFRTAVHALLLKISCRAVPLLSELDTDTPSELRRDLGTTWFCVAIKIIE